MCVQISTKERVHSLLARLVLYIVGLTTSLSLSWMYLFDYFKVNETAVVLWGAVDLVLSILIILFIRHNHSFKTLLTFSIALLLKSFFQVIPMLLWLFLHDVTLYDSNGNMFTVQSRFALPHIVVIVSMLSLLYLTLYQSKDKASAESHSYLQESGTEGI